MEPELLRLLIEHGANVNSKATLGYSPLLYAVDSGSLSNIKVLLKFGADVNAKSQEGETAFTLAQENLREPDRTEVLRALHASQNRYLKRK